LAAALAADAAPGAPPDVAHAGTSNAPVAAATPRKTSRREGDASESRGLVDIVEVSR